jgi:hypothetical protein
MIGRIYKLEGNGLTYYGSTTTSLQERLYKHRSAYKLWLMDKARYCSSFEIIKGEHTIVLIDEGKFETKHQMRQCEKYWITNNPCINKQIPNRTDALRYEENKEKIAIRNKEPILCQCGKTIKKGNMREHLQSKKHQSFSSGP